ESISLTFSWHDGFRVRCFASPRNDGRLQLHHHVVALDPHGNRLGDIGAFDDVCAGLDMRRIRLDAEPARVAVGLSGAYVEFPAVPRAADDLAEPGVFDLAGIVRLREPDQRAFAERGALMRAAIEQPEELALDVEDRDRPAVDLE